MKVHESKDSERRFIISIALTSLILVAEVVGGIYANSLALLSDAAHVFMDIFALGLSFFALRISARPSDDQHTYGYHRVEVFASLVNGISLLAISIGIVIEAINRFRNPLQVRTTEMLIIAIIGLVVNLVVAFVLGMRNENTHVHQRRDLNIYSAFMHVIGDALSSVGVIAAAIVIASTNAQWVDPLVSFLISGLLLVSAYRILHSSLHILIEGVPEGLSIGEIKDQISAVPSVQAVHDLHVWNICSGTVSLSAHVVMDSASSEATSQTLRQINSMLEEKFDIDHTTIQLETDSKCCSSGGCN